MKIIAFITDPTVIRQILEHLGLWRKIKSLGPQTEDEPIIYEPLEDDWPEYEDPFTTVN